MNKKYAFVFRGGGIFFYWKMGWLRHVSKKYHVEDVPLIGASAGALSAVLCACGVDIEHAMQRAYAIMDKHKVGKRFLGLFGIWKTILKEWLEEILPDNVATQIHGRVHILITTLPFHTMVISDFTSKQDVVECLLASCHIPLFMDYLPFCYYRQRLCYDGAIGLNWSIYHIFGDEEYNYVYVDYSLDECCQKYSQTTCCSIQDIQKIVNFGASYAKKLDQQGFFSFLKPKTC